MGESQSRYSIVADMTNTKLEIISARANLDNEANLANQRVTELKESLKDWEASQKDDVARVKRERESQIKQAERESTNAIARKSSKQKAFDEKLKAIDEALNKIQAISDASATEAKK